ncbi:hypothetical protein [Vibrio mimicus]|uniref:hypothetical protein n=1 Tax=Vibrio mimicus TaxID=674 RepID=UPI0011D3A64C|nr:hypothetical protein [Vibrio mimicus]TXY44809.1 hypothetical protein FXE78_17875 [Vibrio mimicus]
MHSNVVKTWELESGSQQEDKILSISKRTFVDAIQSGIYQYKSVNKFHPITAGGSRAWEEIVSSFREMVVDQNQGWKAVQEDGMPLLVNASEQLTIVITSGDLNTGLDSDVQPRTRNQKGQATQSLVQSNYSLFEDVVSIDSQSKTADSHETWVFLYHIDKSKSEVRFELSLPTEPALSGAKGKVKISSWSHRYLFEPVPFDGQVPNLTPPTFTDDADFFDPIKK